VSRRKRMIEELDQDIRDHIAIEMQDNIERGMTPEEARHAALRKFGNIAKVKDETHEVWSVTWLERLLQDVRFGVRTLWKNPGYAIAAILTLALGIGANTAMFSVVRGVLLAPLPFHQPERLVIIGESRPNLNLKELDVSYPDFQDWQRDAHSFEQMATLTWSSYDLTGSGTPQHIDGMQVSAGFFATLDVPMALGRDFSRSEDQPQGAQNVIISNRLWKDRFRATPQVLGQYLKLDGADYTIIGVLPPGFRFLTEADVYTPLAVSNPKLCGDRTFRGIVSIARLKPGISIAQAQGELSTVQAQLDNLYPAADRNLGIHIDSLKHNFVGDTAGMLFMLLGAVIMVLLIACANVANLLFARAAAREREFAVRSALGASRMRVVRQLLTESVLLALTGGLIGLGIAKLALVVVLGGIRDSLPRGENVGLDWTVLLFAFGVSLAVGILFGLAPAMKSTSKTVFGSLKAGGRGSTRAHLRSQGIFVIVQMGLTLVLLTGCSLLLRTVRELRNVNPGFEAKNVVTFKVGLSPSMSRTEIDVQVAFQQLVDRIRQLPGVEAVDVAVALSLPLSERDHSGPFWVGAQEPASMQDAPHALLFWAGPDYLRTMRIPLLRGRFFTPADTLKSERVIAIDDDLAHTYFPGKDPVGQTINVAWQNFGPARIIGVVGHVKNWGLNDPGTDNPSQIYISVYQLQNLVVPDLAKYLTIVVRTPLDTAAVMPAIKNVVYGAAEDQTVYRVRTMQEVVSATMSSQRLAMVLLAAFAGLALLVASIGFYGVISYSVTQRVQEIGVRVALGAKPRDVLQLVLGQGLRLAIAGLIVGAVAVFLLGRSLPSFSQLLYGVKATDLVTLLIASGVLLGVAIVACYIPARRALKIDPIVALRYD
jgi:predicted permease